MRLLLESEISMDIRLLLENKVTYQITDFTLATRPWASCRSLKAEILKYITYFSKNIYILLIELLWYSSLVQNVFVYFNIKMYYFYFT